MADLADVRAEAFFPLVSRACADLEAATVRHVRDQFLAAEPATSEEIRPTSRTSPPANWTLMLAPPITAWGRKPATR